MAVCGGAGAAAAGDGGEWCNRFRGGPGDAKGCENTADAWCGVRAANDTDLTRRAYLASVAFVDEQVAAIHDALASTGLLENTFVIWSADHGDGQGDMHHWRKGYPYEFSAHVPMLLRWPERWAAAQAAAGTPVTVARGATLAPPIVTELRDVFHTLVDAAGVASDASLVPRFGSGAAAAFDAADGKSMLCLLRDPSGATCDYAPNPGPWRSWLDLEHSQCYNATNQWSALTDGRTKFIYNAYFGQEQLFNLTADPRETVDLASNAAHAATLAAWRARLVAQFRAEGRGPNYVTADGKLVQNLKRPAKGGGFPVSPAPAAGQGIKLAPSGGGTVCDTNDCFVLDAGANASALRVNATATAMGTQLCLATSGATSRGLIVDTCSAGSPAQDFNTSRLPSNHAAGQAIVHAPSGLCVTAAKSNSTASLAPCVAGIAAQSWVFGMTGRLCSDHSCLHVDAQWPA